MSRPATLIEPGTVKLERLLPGPIERVWAYITESDKREKWLCSGHFDLRVGGNVELRFDNSKLSPHEEVPEGERGRHEPKAGVVTCLEPPHLLAHTWVWDDTQTEVTYELAERGAKVLLTIVHRNLGKSKELVPRVLGGWDVHTGILEDLLNGVKPRSFWSTWAQAAQEYAKENAAALERA
jgi:uncharacterized protein YndB with AHSA1/START domain